MDLYDVLISIVSMSIGSIIFIIVVGFLIQWLLIKTAVKEAIKEALREYLNENLLSEKAAKDDQILF